MRNAITIATMVALVGVVPGVAGAQGQQAAADLKDASGASVGTATMTESGGVRLDVRVQNLPPGVHGIHLHAVGQCAGPDFMSAGGHFNPANKQHGLRNPQGAHAGDLPNLTVAADGTGSLQATASMVTLGAGDMSLFDADGSALVIHVNPDDDVTDPTGNSGGRIACGVIARSAGGQAAQQPGTLPRSGLADERTGAQGALLAGLVLILGGTVLRRVTRA